jgi:peptidoglycan/xylan/chitin deacetylase (PgdA/CDA1 family)
VSRPQGERRPVVRALGTAVVVALVGALALVGGHDVAASVEQPERSTNSLLGPAPGDEFGTTLPNGSARGSHLPGLTTSPGRPTGPDAEQEGEQGTPAPPEQPPQAPTSGTTSKVLYLTFDDGPDPTWTPKVLEVLRRYGVHATFFELGIQVKEHPTLPALVRADGHRIGNHTYSHTSLPSLDAAHLRAQIEHGPAATCLRPPFGAVNARVRTAAARAGQKIVLWDVDTRDWSKPGTAKVVHTVLRNVHPGATVLMHDAGGDRSETVAALRVVLPKLIAEGYTFATVPGC